ncbi:FAD-dependent monooxygenase [Paludisphaera mucosa]|uniref:FAD-dependent monooxygenase n=1 Tax=Paludisphaera mucosa TaxID=3030827 RepID=A0ABT6FCX3_9BACT|nr:FAD-dependent monooxygenase [Paludisphaera mucosa]
MIVGAGIGGLSAHLAFAGVGFEVAHYERRSELGPAGAGIFIWPDGVKVLRTLGLGERLAAIGNRPDFLVMRGPDGRPLSELPLKEIWDRSGAPGYVVSRTNLQDLLLDAVGPGRLQLGMRCIGLDQSDTEVIVHFDGGLEAIGDLAVGADGIHSAVRSVVAPDVEPSYAGIASWVGIVPNDGVQPEDTVVEYLGEGKRFGLLPLSNNRVYFNFAAAWDRGRPRPATGWSGFLERLFAGWPPQVPAVLRRLEGREPIHLEICDLPHLDRWSSVRVALLGDAAHATTPTVGQGACQALEDVDVLVRCLQSDPADVDGALRRYESERKGRAEEIVAFSRRGLERLHARDESIYGETYRAIHASSAPRTAMTIEGWLARGPNG